MSKVTERGHGSLGETRRVRVEDLVHYPGNARVHDLAAIADSLDEHGLYRPVVVQESTMHVLAGNGTVEAARDLLGWTHLDVYVVDVDDDRAARINLVDNRTSELGSYDEQALAAQLEALADDLTGTGYTDADLDALQAQLAKLAAQAVGDAPEDADTIPVAHVHESEVGDLWELGEHRLIVGDATDPAVVDRLVDGETMDAVWTDPPYGIDLWADMTPEEAERLNHRTDGLVVPNDGDGDHTQVILGAWQNIVRVCRGGAPVYVATAPGREHYGVPVALMGAGYDLRQTLVWVKHRLSFSRMDYHFQHELILYGFTPGGRGRKGRGGSRWYGTDNRVTVLEHDKPTASDEHPTMKPVSLIMDMLRNSAKRGDRVLDTFAGSGSTMAACHELGQRAYLVEIEPGYADVICARYQRMTGDKPVRNGVPVDFLTR